MIDIYGIFDFKNQPAGKFINPFLDICDNNSADYDLKETKFGCGRIYYIKMKQSNPSYSDKTIHIFNFGTAIVNRNYNKIASPSPKILQPAELYDFYDKFNTEMVNYLKGNFSIVIYDDNKKELLLISSRLSTLSLFYCYRGGIFIFSSSLRALLKAGNIQPAVDEKALVEQLIFYYPLSGKTYFNNIFQLQPAHIVKVNQDGIEQKKYWQIEDLFRNDGFILENDALYRCLDLMKENLKVYTSDAKKFLLSLTAGFDSRTNLALIEKDPKDFLCYSYGMPGSRQIEIPLFISKKLGLDYKPIYLAKEFEERYEEYALKAVEFSDGTAPILRANFPYAFERLREFSRINITGLFGSEIIKPFARVNEQVSQETIDLFMAHDFNKAFKQAAMKVRQMGYIKAGVVDKYIQEIKNDFNAEYITRLSSFDNITRFYIFLLEEAIRKYFMQEIMIERFYVQTRTPYFDDDFLELIFRTPFAGIYKGAGKSIYFRKDSQVFYAKLIKKTKPELGKIITDRGYKPDDLLLPTFFKIFQIAPRYLKEVIKRKFKKNDTFNLSVWPHAMIGKYIYKIGQQDDCFTDKLIENFTRRLYLKGDFRFFSIFSLKLWMHLLNNKR